MTVKNVQEYQFSHIYCLKSNSYCSGQYKLKVLDSKNCLLSVFPFLLPTKNAKTSVFSYLLPKIQFLLQWAVKKLTNYRLLVVLSSKNWFSFSYFYCLQFFRHSSSQNCLKVAKVVGFQGQKPRNLLAGARYSCINKYF